MCLFLPTAALGVVSGERQVGPLTTVIHFTALPLWWAGRELECFYNADKYSKAARSPSSIASFTG